MPLEPLPFAEAIAFFKGKIPMSATRFAELAEEMRAKAFSVAGQQNWQIIAGTKEGIVKALEKGTTFRDFQKYISQFYDAMGVTRLNSHLASTVFRTNIQTSYQVGRYEQMTDPEILKRRPYWQYQAVDDEGSREDHLEHNGKVYAADHSFWDEWYPPNGFNCRCTVTSVSEEEVEEEGLKVETRLPVGRPDSGFRTIPGK